MILGNYVYCVMRCCLRVLEIISELDKPIKVRPDLCIISNVGSYCVTNFFGYSFLPISDVERILNRGSNDPHELEFLGYVDGLNSLSSINVDDFDECIIRLLHRKICYNITTKKVQLGDYKTISNNIMSGDVTALNRGSLILKTLDPWKAPMFVKSSISDFKNLRYHDSFVLNVAIFIGVFLYISPFQKGNISIARALTIFFLSSRYAYARYFVNWNFLDIHDQLCRKALSSIDPDLHWDDWLEYFLNKILFFKNMICESYKSEEKVGSLSEMIIKLFLDYDELTIAKICALTGANRNTIKLHLKNLVQADQIEMHGSGRGVWYTKKKYICALIGQ